MTLTLLLLAVSMTLFTLILVRSVVLRRRSSRQRIRRVWLLLVLMMLAALAGASFRFALLAVRVGWLPLDIEHLLLVEWQLLLSAFVGALGTLAYFAVAKESRAIEREATHQAALERVAGYVMERARDVDLMSLSLTKKEREVLAVIGAGTVSDSGLADALFVAQSTAHSHVQSLMRKTGLKRRDDLVALAILLDLQETGALSTVEGRPFPLDREADPLASG